MFAQSKIYFGRPITEAGELARVEGTVAFIFLLLRTKITPCLLYTPLWVSHTFTNLITCILTYKTFMKHAQEPTSSLGSGTSALVGPLRPNRSWPPKFDRCGLQNPLCGKKCSPQPKHPEDDVTDGKGYDSMLLRYNTKPSYRSTTSSSMEVKKRVGK